MTRMSTRRPSYKKTGLVNLFQLNESFSKLYILYQKRLSFSDALELAVTSKGCKLRIVAHAKNIVAIALILHGIGLLAQALLLKAEKL